jgi:two-component system nitrogen regulation response regulator GlnG
MAAATQAKMLRLLQQQEFHRVGGNETVKADVRVIAATNHDLEAAVADGRFRQDLLYRLNGFTIRLPALRDRTEDIDALADHFLLVCAQQMHQTCKSIAPEALALLKVYSWPGNVRELQSAIRYSIVQSVGDVVTAESMPESVRLGSARPAQRSSKAGGGALDVANLAQAMIEAGEEDVYRRVCLEVDRIIMDVVLRHTRGNQLQASEVLGISRTTLRAKMRALGLGIEKHLLSESGHDG